MCYIGKDLIILRNKTEARRKHNAKDRHKETADRHNETEARKKHNAKDRHKETADRHKETKTSRNKKQYRERKVRILLSDTGMDLICCSCVEWKSRNSCVSSEKFTVEKLYKYCTETDLTRNADDRFYVCQTCKLMIDKNIEPRRCQKEILGLLNFPTELMEYLEQKCTPWSKKQRKDPEKKYVQLNRVEDYLLKPVIPFIRIAHLLSTQRRLDHGQC